MGLIRRETLMLPIGVKITIDFAFQEPDEGFKGDIMIKGFWIASNVPRGSGWLDYAYRFVHDWLETHDSWLMERLTIPGSVE